MSTLVRVYNQSRWSFLIIGLLFTAIGIYGLFNPEDLSFSKTKGIEITDEEERKNLVTMLAIGVILLFIHLCFMKYRKNKDFSDDIPLPKNVNFERTDDVNENIRRYQQAQLEAQEAQEAIRNGTRDNRNV